MNMSRYQLALPLMVVLVGYCYSCADAQVVYPGIFKEIVNNNLAGIQAEIDRDKSVIDQYLPASGETPLLLAISKRRLDAVDLLLEAGANINLASRNGQSPLQLALLRRRRDIVEAILDRNPDVNIVDKRKSTALMNAIMYQADTKTVKRILELGADIQVKDRNGITPLMMACRYNRPESAMLILDKIQSGQIQVAELNKAFLSACESGMESAVVKMLELGADPRSKDSNDATALHLACTSNSGELVSLLLSYYTANLNLKDRNQKTPLCYAVFFQPTESIYALVQNGADPNFSVASRRGPLALACSAGKQGIVEALLKLRADPNQTDQDGNTPLHILAQLGAEFSGRNRKGKSKVIGATRALLASGANVNARNKLGQTPIEIAVAHEFFDQVDLLVKFGANVDFNVGPTPMFHWVVTHGLTDSTQRILQSFGTPDLRDQSGQTPLMVASAAGQLEIMDQLLGANSNVRLKDNSGQSAIHHAAANNQPNAISKLLSAGAEINAQDNSGQSALHLSAWSGATSASRQLLRSGADPNLKSNSGYTPLFGAAWQGHPAVVRQLGSANANLDTMDDDGWTALQKAAYRGHSEVVKILLAKGADMTAKDRLGLTVMDKAKSPEILAILKEHQSQK